MKRSALAASVAALSLVGLVGCGPNPDDVSYDAIIHDLSPELMASVERPVDVNRNMNMTSDFNSRMFWDDMGRAFYTDRPSRLSPMPVPAASPNPR